VFWTANYNRPMVTSNIKLMLVAVTACAMAGCVPLHLQKYRQQQDHRLTPTPATPSGESLGGATAPGEAGNAASPPQDTAVTIYPVDKETFRLQIPERDVWEAVLSVLMRNYSPLIADKNQGIFATDWDSYFLNGAVYRNKISLRLSRGGPGVTDMVIHNSVEQLRDGSQATGGASGPWLPSADPADEIGRIVKNMAIVLGQPAPRLQQVR
jgi:hypothetical protein